VASPTIDTEPLTTRWATSCLRTPPAAALEVRRVELHSDAKDRCHSLANGVDGFQ
jgi:hypothetical protein